MMGNLKTQMAKLKTTTKILKLLTFALLLYALPFTLLALPTHAQSPTPSPIPYTLTPIPSSIPPTSPVYTDLLVHNLFHTFSCLSIGSSIIGQPCLTYQMTQNAQGAIQGVPVLSSANLSGGLLGTATGLIAGLYLNPPVRTVDYLASVGQGLGIVKEARAQVVGSGANVLNPILTLWQVSRNISYVILILIFVIIGLMVMFRTRINPQTVITAQAALPGLVIGLILITFSYFFAALISDTAFIGTNLVGYYFSIAQRPGQTPQDLVANISSKNVLGIFTPFTKAIGQEDVHSALSSIWDNLADLNTSRWNPFDLDPQKVITILTGFMVSQFLMPFGGLGGGLGQLVAGALSLGTAAIAPISVASFVLAFIAMLILIYAMLKLLLRLINAFLTIIFLTITAPFQFLAASLPGRQGIATGWILNMLANILAFPAVLAVFYFVAFILGSKHPMNQPCTAPTAPTASCTFIISRSNQTPDNSFATPVYAQGASQQTGITGTATFPLFGGLNLDLIRLLLAFGALVALPSIPDIIARIIGRLGVAGQLIGQELGGSIAQGRGYAGQFQQGATGMAGQVGRLTNEPHYFISGVDEQGRPIYKIDPLLSRTGLLGKWRASMMGAKRGEVRSPSR